MAKKEQNPISAEERIQLVSDGWYIKEPALFMIFMSHVFTANSSIWGIRSGQGRVEYNAAYLAALSAKEAEEVLKAEMIRILLRHPYRWPPRNTEVSYIASNITLNEYYRFNFLPYRASDFWNDPEYKQRNFEFYYREYLEMLWEQMGSKDEAQSGGDETSAHNAENAALWTNDDFVDMKVRSVIEFIQQNMLSWGTMPGTLVQSIVATLKPILDYRKVLSGFRATVLSSKMTLTRFRPSRRYGFVYMGKKSRFTTRLLIGVDVSGSISDKEISLFYSTINRFFKYGIEQIDVQQFDADLQGKPLLMKKAQKEIQVKGRGGTCFQPLIDYFAANRNTYNGLIIFTDGDAPQPNIAPRDTYRVLWICNNKQSYEAHQEWMSKQGRCCWIQT